MYFFLYTCETLLSLLSLNKYKQQILTIMYQVIRTPMQAHINGGKSKTNTFNTLTDAQLFFAAICDELGYEYIIGATEAGGRGHDYLIQITEA